MRESTLAFSSGRMTFIRPHNRSVLAYVRQYGGEVILCVANLSRSAQATELDLSPWKERIRWKSARFPAIGELPYMITLAPLGFYWFQLTARDRRNASRRRCAPNSRPSWCRWARPGYRWPTPAAYSNATCCLDSSREHAGIRNLRRRPFTPTPRLGDPVLRHRRQPPLSYLSLEATQRGVTARYVLPIRSSGCASIASATTRAPSRPQRQGARKEPCLDIASDQIFIALLLYNLHKPDREENGLRLEFRPTTNSPTRTSRRAQHIRAIETGRTARRWWIMIMW